MHLDQLPTDALDDLVEELRDLRHDLGKYVCFETRFVEDEGDTESLRRALRSDLLSTHRRHDRVEAAWEVWRRLRPAELEGDPDVARLDADLAQLEGIDLDADGSLAEAARLARAVGETTRSLLTRALARLEDLDG